MSTTTYAGEGVVTKQSLLHLVKQHKSLYIRSIHRIFRVNPDNDADRVKVWKIGQGLAELVRDGDIQMQISQGQRMFYVQED